MARLSPRARFVVFHCADTLARGAKRRERGAATTRTAIRPVTRNKTVGSLGSDGSFEIPIRLTAAHVPNELVLFDGLDHQLDDSAARTQMLRESEAFLRANLHLAN